MSAPLPATDRNVERARAFAMRKWVERHHERNGEHSSPPKDLSSSCKFTSLFAQQVFGGELEGNWGHQYVRLADGAILDLNAGAEDVIALGDDAYGHDPSFWGNREHRESLDSCRARSDAWAREFLEQGEE